MFYCRFVYIGALQILYNFIVNFMIVDNTLECACTQCMSCNLGSKIMSVESAVAMYVVMIK